MNIFDRFLIGDVGDINFNFKNTHFLERLRENGLTHEYIMECVFEMEPVSWQHVEANKYAVVYPAPENKDYKEIRLLMGCSDNSINMITVMMNNETATMRQTRHYQSKEKREIEKKRLKAISKRKF